MSVKHYLIHINDRCDMRCAYCYDGRARTGGEMAEPVIDACLAFCARTAGDEPVSLMFLGGEPTLSPGVLRRFLRGAAPDWHFELMTNAFGWPEGFLDSLRPWRERMTIIASYDGLFQEQRKPGSAGRVRGNIQRALDEGFSVMPSWTLTDETTPRLVDNARHLLASFRGLRRLFIKRNCRHNLWAGNAVYLQGLAGQLDRYAALLAHARVARGVYIQTINRIDRGDDPACSHRGGTFSCQTGFPWGVTIGMDGALYPCEVYACARTHPLGDVWRGHDQDELRAMSAAGYAGAAPHNNVCPYWNEAVNGDWRDCSACLNDPADRLLLRARGRVHDHLNRLGRLKNAFAKGAATQGERHA